jgi:serine/threonine protein kinase
LCVLSPQDKKIHFRELRQEIDILRKMQHQHVIRLYDVYESMNELAIVMEICTGGELFDRIVRQRTHAANSKRTEAATEGRGAERTHA